MWNYVLPIVLQFHLILYHAKVAHRKPTTKDFRVHKNILFRFCIIMTNKNKLFFVIYVSLVQFFIKFDAVISAQLRFRKCISEHDKGLIQSLVSNRCTLFMHQSTGGHKFLTNSAVRHIRCW